MTAVVAFTALHGTGVLVTGLVLAGFAAAAVVLAAATVVSHRPSALQQRLEAYGDVDSSRTADSDGGDGATALAHTALFARVVELTEEFAERRGFLTKVGARLEQADLPLRPAEVIFVDAVGVVLLTVLVLVVSGNFAAGLVVFALALLVPPAVLNYLARKRKRTFLTQLPDMLHVLAGSLRAGFSLMQGVEAVAQEMTDPMAKELRRVVTESRLGRDLEESLEGVAERMESPDFAWAVMAVRIQREVGGNLSELLMTVADTMVARERLRRDVAALTAEGRISAIVLGIMPLALGIVMFVMNPTYMHPLFSETLGQVFLGLGVVGMVVGFLWMKKTVEVEI